MVAVLCVAARTTAAAAASDSPEAGARGAYLAAAAGCETCHTDRERGGAAYAGGRMMATEYGTITTPNITPDRATGIGRWTDQDFTRSMRWGIAPDDTHYVPVFPFPAYNRLTEADLTAIRTYLYSLAPVSRPDLKSTAGPGLLPRAKNAVAIALSPAPGPWLPDPNHDAVWNRGAYLVVTIGRCGECHTPRDWLGRPDPHRLLAGSPGDGRSKKAPNITPDRSAGIGNWSENDIVEVLTTGHTPDFDEVGGSMAEIVKNTARLSDTDRRAIAVYLESIPALPGPISR
ncbi:MAG: cytochrome c [Alphaproteobacteria bacterium]|nr:cytochrome c [Alphaproteobacteria bacterium]